MQTNQLLMWGQHALNFYLLITWWVFLRRATVGYALYRIMPPEQQNFKRLLQFLNLPQTIYMAVTWIYSFIQNPKNFIANEILGTTSHKFDDWLYDKWYKLKCKKNPDYQDLNISMSLMRRPEFRRKEGIEDGEFVYTYYFDDPDSQKIKCGHVITNQELENINLPYPVFLRILRGKRLEFESTDALNKHLDSVFKGTILKNERVKVIK